MTPPFRKTLSWLHTWSGLVLGLVIVLLAVTGAGLVLQPQLDAVVNRALLTVPPCTAPLPLDRIAASPFAERVTLHVSGERTRFDIPALFATEPRDAHVYVCGSSAFMEAVIAAARTASWPEALIHREYFAAAHHDIAADTAFDVRIASTGQTVRVERGQSVVAALGGCGIEIPIACAEGVCGTCLTHVLEGDIAHRDMFLTDEERARNDQFTPCCSRARGTLLVLDL